MNPFKFHGTGRQFFSIWIVNILLTIVTLGIYAAWAHVRTKKYFYGNTELAGDRFEFLATPKQVLIGYLVMFVLFVLTLIPVLGFVVVLAIMIASPWLIQRGLRFNAQMTRFRGIRFDFKGSVKGAFVNFIGKPLLGYLGIVAVVGLLVLFLQMFKSIESLMPFLPLLVLLVIIPLLSYFGAWVGKGVHSYVHNGYFYGSEQFNAQYRTNVFFKFNLIATAILFVILMLPVALLAPLFTQLVTDMESQARSSFTPDELTVFVGFYIVFILAALISSAYYTCKIRNYTYAQTFIGQDKHYRLSSTMVVKSYLALLLSNFLMVILSLGLLTPFARIRHALYMANATQVYGDLDALSSKELAMEKTSSVADAVASGFDINVSF